MRTLGTPLVLLALSSIPSAGLTAQDWPQFRGPGGVSAAPGEKLPLPFGPGENQRWKTEIPAGHSSPCISGDRIFLTGAEGDQMIMLALDRASGKELWRKAVTSTAAESYMHSDAAPAQPTPCTDGEVVTFYFGQYGLVTTDLDGKELWSQKLAVPQTGFGTGTSPIIVGGMLIVQRDGPPDWSLAALDPATGEEFWSISRPGFGPSYATPFLWSNDERDELIVAGTRTLRSYDPGTGEELWEVGDLTVLTCTTATADDDMLYYAAWSTSNAEGSDRINSFFGDLEFTEEEHADPEAIFGKLDTDGDGKITPEELPDCRAKDAFGFVDQNQSGSWELAEYVGVHNFPLAPGQNRAIAVKPGGSGDITGSHVAWSVRRGIPYVASPLVYDGRIYLAKAGGFLTCLDAKTGKAFYDRERLDDRGEYYASPLGVGEHVLVCARPGTAFVIKSADELEIVDTIEFDDEIHATPAMLDGTLYVRTTNAMWAFGAETP